MKCISFACLFLYLTTTFLLSQSNPVPLVNQTATVAPAISASQYVALNLQSQATKSKKSGHLSSGSGTTYTFTQGRADVSGADGGNLSDAFFTADGSQAMEAVPDDFDFTNGIVQCADGCSTADALSLAWELVQFTPPGDSYQSGEGGIDADTQNVTIDGGVLTISGSATGSATFLPCVWNARHDTCDPTGDTWVLDAQFNYTAVFNGGPDYWVLQDASMSTPDTAATVSPKTLNFGQVLPGQTSPPKLVSLKNTGTSELTVSNIAISPYFNIATNHCANGVKPGTHCNVDVTFSPTALGTENGTLSFADSASGSPQIVSLIGMGSNMVATDLTLTSSPNPSTDGEPVIFTAMVTPPPPNGEIISFMNGKTVLGTGPLSSGSATLDISTLKTGTKVVTAVYGGDSTFNGSTSNAVKQVVNTAPKTTIWLHVRDNPSYYLQDIILDVGVESENCTNLEGGEIDLYIDGAFCCSDNGPGTSFNIEGGLFVGNHALYATYINYWGCSGSKSPTVKQVVDKNWTATTISSNPNPAIYGQPITYTVSVSSQVGFDNIPAGNVKLTGIGLLPLNHGGATITKTGVKAGTYAITAEYLGDGNSYPSTSPVLEEVVNPAATTTVLTSSVNPSSSKQTVTFTATVTSSTGVSPYGTVTFTAGAKTLGTVAVSNNVAHISTVALPVGSTTITATYNGSASFVGSSASLIQTVN